MRSPVVAGLLLAAGAGRRMGRPKALVELDGEPLLVRALRAMADAGLGPRVVVLGAGAETAGPLVAGTGARAVLAPDWATGMGASLRAGLAALRPDTGVGDPGGAGADAVVVHLVDTPGIGAAALRRVAAHAHAVAAAGGTAADALGRGAYGGRPGHPVLLGAAHWAAVADAAEGDAGARGYLAGARVHAVEVGDVADPADLDTPEDLAALAGAAGSTIRAGHRREREG